MADAAMPGIETMDIVDAQVHGFLTLRENEMLAAMDALGIQAVVIDELWGRRDDGSAWPCMDLPNGVARPISPLAQAASLKYPDRFSFLQRVNRLDPDLTGLFAMLGSSSGCRAVRINICPREEREAFADGAYDSLLGLARTHGLPVCILGRDTGATVYRTVNRFPEVKFVIDHCGSPKSPQQWNEVLALGDCKNIWLKWSHGHHFFDAGQYPFQGLQVQLARAIDAFGIERIIWASDFTHNRSGTTWADLLYYLRDSPSLGPGDKEWLFARAARTVFGWQPPSVARDVMAPA